MARETYANGTPKVDLDAWRLSEYADEMRKKYCKDDEALFRETKEWCTKYSCPYGFWAIFVKLFDALLKLAMDVIYASISALMDLFYATVGTVARIADEIVIVGCYILSWSSAGKTCCKKSVIINAIIEFVQSVSDLIASVFQKAIEIWMKFMGIMEKLFYKCDCDRIVDEMQNDYKEELEVAKNEHPGYSKYKAVLSLPKVKEDGTYYLVVKPYPDTFSDSFVRHVNATVDMYNKWPYGAVDDCPKAWFTNALTIWKSYVNILVEYWLSSINLRTNGNKSGYSVEQHNAMMDYCKSAMPEELWFYTLSRISDTDDALKKKGLIK